MASADCMRRAVLTTAILAAVSAASATEPIWYWNFQVEHGISFTDDKLLKECMKALIPTVLKDGTPIPSWPNGFAVTGIGPAALANARDIWTRQAPEKIVLPVGKEITLVIRGMGNYELKQLTRNGPVFTLEYQVIKDNSAWHEQFEDESHYPWASIALISVGQLPVGKYEVHAGEICGPFSFDVR